MKNLIISTLIRAFCAVVIGGIIGNERAKHGRAAGMRTHILVCLGACMTSLTSVYISQYMNMSGDVMRLPAQVISGIGFLGAGMIILKNNTMITGLTTAAGVWTTATIGIALGYGYYIGAVIVSVLFMITIIFFSKFEKRSTEVIYVELNKLNKVNEITDKIKEIIQSEINYQIFSPKSNTVGSIGLNIVIDRKINVDISAITNLDGVVFAVIEQ